MYKKLGTIVSLFLGFYSCINATLPLKSHPAFINEWCFIDTENQVVYPWFTQPFLAELSKWNTRNWEVFEWGSGYSTGWFAKQCKHITSVENSSNWREAVVNYLHSLGHTNFNVYTRECKNVIGGEIDCHNDYIDAIHQSDQKYDCIIIDGMYRNACAKAALAHIKPGGLIILDNANQKSIGLNSESTFELLASFPHFSFKQPEHLDWRTDYWIIN